MFPPYALDVLALAFRRQKQGDMATQRISNVATNTAAAIGAVASVLASGKHKAGGAAGGGDGARPSLLAITAGAAALSVLGAASGGGAAAPALTSSTPSSTVPPLQQPAQLPPPLHPNVSPATGSMPITILTAPSQLPPLQHQLPSPTHKSRLPQLSSPRAASSPANVNVSFSPRAITTAASDEDDNQSVVLRPKLPGVGASPPRLSVAASGGGAPPLVIPPGSHARHASHRLSLAPLPGSTGAGGAAGLGSASASLLIPSATVSQLQNTMSLILTRLQQLERRASTANSESAQSK